MKLLDTRGYVYDVYDQGNGRVLKKEKPAARQYLLHRAHDNTPAYVREHKERARKLAAHILDRGLIGDPVFLGKRSYTQDRVVILEEYILSHTLSENKKVVDVYIRSIYDSWANGFSDIIFNFSHNAGVNGAGRVILIDFNEVTFNKNVIFSRLKAQRWLKALSYTTWLPEGPLKEYYATAMSEAMTPENLDRYWRDNKLLHE